MSNLLQKASIVTTPTAYGVGVLNSIKPAYALSEELVTNGGFESSASWTVSGTDSTHIATFSNGTLRYQSDTTSPQLIVAQAGVLQTGRLYKITVNVTNLTSGSVKVDSLGGLNITPSAGTNIFYKTATGTTFNITRATTNVDVTIDSVSVKLITDADFDFTRNSSATRVNPDYLIQDVSILSSNLVQNGNFSELGSELITNGSFATDSDWSLTQATIINGAANISTTGSLAGIVQSSVTTSGKTYKFNIEITNIQTLGSGISLTSGGLTSSILNTFTTLGTHTVYFTATSTTIGIKRTTGATDITIDNVSVKQVDPNDNWTLGGGWSFGTDKLERTAQSGSTSTTQSFSFNAGVKYKISYNLNISAGSFKIRISGGTLIDTPVRTTSGTYTEIITANSGNNVINLRANDAAFSGSITNISVIEVQQTDIPRIDYTDGCGSILLEGQSTNLITYSEDFSQSVWTKNDVTVTSGFLSPDGLLNAYSITEDTSNSTHYVQTQNINVLANKYTFSAFIKSNGRDVIRIQGANYFSGGVTADFNLTTKTIVLGIRATNGKIEDCGNGWFRCSFTSSENAVAGNNAHFRIYLKDGITYTGDGSSGVFVWGAQIEQQSYPTSYIPTEGSVVTRAAETLNNAGNSSLINSTEGVLYAELKVIDTDSTNKMITLSNGTNSTRVLIRYVGTTFQVQLRISGSNQYEFAYTPSNITDNLKIALKYKVNDFSLYVNGTKLNSSNSGNVFSSGTLTELAFDDGGGSSNFYGNVKSVAVFKEALSDTELACLTSTNNREIFLNYYYRMQYVGANTEALSCAEQTFNI